MCLNMGGAVPLIMGKQVKAIATLSRDRSPLMPDLPTAHEQGLADFDVVTWNAFFLPKGAPPEIVKKLNDATSQAMDTPAIKSRMHDIGVTGVALERRSPEYLAKFVVDEIARWAGQLRRTGFRWIRAYAPWSQPSNREGKWRPLLSIIRKRLRQLWACSIDILRRLIQAMQSLWRRRSTFRIIAWLGGA